MRETGARRRIGDANQVLAGGALNLPAGVNRFALQRLVAVLAMEFKFSVIHKLHSYMRNPGAKSIWRNIHTFLPRPAHVVSDEESEEQY
jgi:hypothetical protein